MRASINRYLSGDNLELVEAGMEKNKHGNQKYQDLVDSKRNNPGGHMDEKWVDEATIKFLKSKIKQTKDKQEMNGYMKFFNLVRSGLPDGIKFTDAAVYSGKAWKNLSPEDRKSFDDVTIRRQEKTKTYTVASKRHKDMVQNAINEFSKKKKKKSTKKRKR
jgi:hypothetical protein